MPKIIKDDAVIDDHWQLMPAPKNEKAAGEKAASTDGAIEDNSFEHGIFKSNTMVPVAVWLAQKSALIHRDDIGVWLNSDDAIELLVNDLSTLPLIAIHFPTFTDGRGFSSARLLRERYGYSGEVRAIGYLLRDQLCYLKRCGFNAFVLQPEVDLSAALASLRDFSESYQTAADQHYPLFRRRA